MTPRGWRYAVPIQEALAWELSKTSLLHELTKRAERELKLDPAVECTARVTVMEGYFMVTFATEEAGR